jgi:DNA-binding GntR family transcriptional regulator
MGLMMTTNAPLFDRPATLRESVAGHLRDMMMQGTLKPGQRLREQALCQALQISRSTLREALRTLEAERLVQMQAHRGPVVASMTTEQTKDLYAMRELLEGYIASSFACGANDSQRLALQQAFGRLQLLASSGDLADMLGAKQGFYQALLEGCPNLVAAEMLSSLLSRINLLRATSLSRPNRVEQSLVEIQAIVQAIDRRDGQAAQRAAKRHVRQAQLAALRVLATGSAQLESHDG